MAVLTETVTPSASVSSSVVLSSAPKTVADCELDGATDCNESALLIADSAEDGSASLSGATLVRVSDALSGATLVNVSDSPSDDTLTKLSDTLDSASLVALLASLDGATLTKLSESV